MSALKYLQQSANKPANDDDAATHDDQKDSETPSKPPPSFVSGFRRSKASDDRTKAKISIAATASVAANARKFVSNFRAKKEGTPSKDLEDVEEDDVPRPRAFNPTGATGAKGFVGAVASHLQENEKRKRQLRQHRAHQMAVKGIYNKKAATTPTTAPPGAPRFFHTLPTALPQTYFADLLAKCEEAQLPVTIPDSSAASPTRHDGTDDVKELRNQQAANAASVASLNSYWECDEVSRDMLQALTFLKAKHLDGKASFIANERVQSLKDVPLREMAQGDFLWRTWRSAVDDFITMHATTALNARYMLGSGKSRFVVIGNSSVLDALEGVLIHVWRSNTAAKEFISGWRRIWRAVFESRLEGVTCPFSASYRVQGSYVSVTALCPLETDFKRYKVNLSPKDIWGSHGAACAGAKVDLADIAPDAVAPETIDSLPVKTAMKRFCHATCTDAPPPLMLGRDGRYYIMDMRFVMQPTFGDTTIKQRPRLDLLLQMRDLRGLLDSSGVVMPFPTTVDRYAEEETGIRSQMTKSLLDSPLNFVKRVAARRCAIDIMRTLAEMDLDIPMSTELILDKNLVSQLCHRFGLNLCFMPLLMDAAVNADIPHEIVPEHQRNRLATCLAEACQVEMLSRTLKELAVLDMNHGVTVSTPINDIGRRIHVPNRIASLAVGKDAMFFQDQVMPRLRRKFYGAADDLFIDPALSSAGRLLRNLIFHLGCELCGEQKRFTHFCPIAQTYAMVMRPPKTAEMYLAKQFTELDNEVPLMWKRWAMTPNTSPVRHSVFVHSSFLTLLCRASEKYTFVRDSADDCMPDFDDDLYLQAEVQAVAAEAALITAREDGPLRAYVAMLRKLQRNGHDDSPIFAVKFLNAALLATRTNLAVTAANTLLRIDGATPVTHSATFAFAVSAAEAMMVGEKSKDVLSDYLSLAREQARQAKVNGPKERVRTMLHTTGVLIASNEESSAYGSPDSVDFAREALRVEMENLGPRNRCTCVGTYHVMVLALRERSGTGVPAVERYLKHTLRVLDMLLKEPDHTKIPAMTHSDRSLDLITRVIAVLRDSGDKTTAGLLRQQKESIIKGEVVENIVDELDLTNVANGVGDEAITADQSNVLASSARSRTALSVEDVDNESDEQLSQSLHSPNDGGVETTNDSMFSPQGSPEAGPASPMGSFAGSPVVGPRKLRFGSQARLNQNESFHNAPADLADPANASLRLSMVNVQMDLQDM